MTELLSADYSLVNADLAKLGMGACLTLTADSLNTSPIRRAVHVMENLMGIHPSRRELVEFEAADRRLIAAGQPSQPRPWEIEPTPVDSTNTFRSGAAYQDIIDFRKIMNSDANRDRFVKCFISKLHVYATGKEPTNYWEVEKILQQSAAHDFRIIETIAAVIDSPLFREEY